MSDAAEALRLPEARTNKVPWRKWGPYLSERQWGTVREDYSPDGNAWDYFTHDQARSHAYHWGEDGLAGISWFGWIALATSSRSTRNSRTIGIAIHQQRPWDFAENSTCRREPGSWPSRLDVVVNWFDDLRRIKTIN